MLQAVQITQLHDEATTRWHHPQPWPDPALIEALGHQPAAELLQTILGNHRANFDLWHEEDKARDPEASDTLIATVKHAIDALNQRRNDLVEVADRTLLDAAGNRIPMLRSTPRRQA